MKILDLNHVALHVQDLERSKHFYGELLGWQEKDTRPAFDFPGVWYQLGPTRELHLLADRHEGEIDMPRVCHFAVQVESIATVQAQFEKAELEFLGPKPRPDGVQQIFLQDPDGYWIEFCELGSRSAL